MATLIETLAERTAAQRGPIPGDKPAGTDVTFDPDFERVKGEIDKLTGLAGAQPSWREVIETGERLLATKAKDMRLAAWVAVSKMHLSGWLGFAEGLSVYHALIKDFWEAMFPELKRARGRANLHSWLGDQVAAYFDGKDPTAAEADAVKACDELLTEIDSMLGDKLGDLYAGPGKLRNLMRDKVRALPVVAPPPPPAPPPVSQAAPSAPRREAAAPPPPAAAAAAPVAAPVAVSAPVMGGDPIQVADACSNTLMEVAVALRAQNPAAPLAYRFLRIGMWMGLEVPPQTEDGHATVLRAPEDDERRALEGMVAAGNWLGLLNAAEEAAQNRYFWLDLHRFSAQALDRLGPHFIAAREMLGKEVVAQLLKFPTLVDLTFSDGTPFADAGTRSWLEEEAKKWGVGGGGGGASAATAEDEELAARMESAKELVASGKVSDALALASALAARGADARARFRGQLAVARMASEAGKAEIARPLLEALTRDIDRHRLEAWEPSACADVYALLLSSLRQLNRVEEKNAEWVQREAQIFDKLCRLAPAVALKIAGG